MLDKIWWGPTSDACYLVKIVTWLHRELICKKKASIRINNKKNFNWIRKLCSAPKIKNFMWLLIHGRLPSTKFLANRGLSRYFTSSP